MPVPYRFICRRKNGCIPIAILLAFLLPARMYGAITLTVTPVPITADFYNSNGVFYNGSLTVVATGGTAPYTYNCVGAINNNGYFTLLRPGTYPIQVTDATGQTATTTGTVGSIYPIPSVNFSTIVYPSTCSSADGTITLVSSGGTGPYLYSIDGGLTFTPNNVFTGLRGGIYLCLSKDANGLLAEVSTAPIQLYDGSIYFMSRSCNLTAYLDGYGTIICPGGRGNNEIDIGAFGGTPPYSFSLDGVTYYAGQAGYGGGYRFPNPTPGLITGYAKDATGTVVMSSTTLTEFCQILATTTVGNANCHQGDGSVTIYPYNTPGPYQYTMDGLHYQSSGTFTGLAAGLYAFQIKDANGLWQPIYVNIQDNCPAITLTTTNAHCGQNDGTITATATNGTPPYQYSRDGGPFQSSNTFGPLPPGHYTITVEDQNYNTATASADIANNCMQLTATTVANTTCSRNNGSITVTTINATPPIQYSLDGNPQPTNFFSNLYAGSHTITAKDANSLTASITVILTDMPPPQMQPALAPPFCANSTGSITLDATGGTGSLLYSIDGGNSFQSGNTFGNLSAQQYSTEVKDINGCTATGTVTLTTLPVPDASLGNNAVLCAGSTLLLTAPQAAGYTYLWPDNSTASTYTVSTPGTYTVKVTNADNCSATGAIQITGQPLPAFTLGADISVCTGHTATLQPAPGFSQATYLWNTGNTGSSLVVNSPGQYSLQVTANGCSKSETVNVTYKPSPVIDLGPADTTLCTGQKLILDVTNPNATYLWQDGSGQPVFTVSSAGVYSVKVDENGCDTTGTMTVDYRTLPLVHLGADTTLCTTETLVLNATWPNSTYLWQDGSSEPAYKVSQPGLYIVQVTNTCGPTEDSIRVGYEDCACKFYMPGAFSPNNDGNNDLFRPKYLCLFSGYECKVFNRWGQLVFASRNAADGWNGSLNGQPQPAGVYVWELSYKDNLTGKRVFKRGTVLLVR